MSAAGITAANDYLYLPSAVRTEALREQALNPTPSFTWSLAS